MRPEGINAEQNLSRALLLVKRSCATKGSQMLMNAGLRKYTDLAGSNR